jgi:hypothetical protein
VNVEINIYEAIKNGPVFIGMWVKYERGSVGSIFGIAQENRDELCLIVMEGGKIGTFTGWPNAGIVLSKASLNPGAWVYLACQWDKMGMTIYIDGKEADKVPVPALDNRLGRLEIGVNSPGGDEYITMMVGTFRIMTGKPISPNSIPKFMFNDKLKIAK